MLSFQKPVTVSYPESVESRLGLLRIHFILFCRWHIEIQKHCHLHSKKHVLNLICSQYHHEYDPGLSLSFQNIWFSPHFQRIYYFCLYYYFILHSGDRTLTTYFLLCLCLKPITINHFLLLNSQFRFSLQVQVSLFIANNTGNPFHMSCSGNTVTWRLWSCRLCDTTYSCTWVSISGRNILLSSSEQKSQCIL